jgi:hypothetical protein
MILVSRTCAATAISISISSTYQYSPHPAATPLRYSPLMSCLKFPSPCCDPPPLFAPDVMPSGMRYWTSTPLGSIYPIQSLAGAWFHWAGNPCRSISMRTTLYTDRRCDCCSTWMLTQPGVCAGTTTPRGRRVGASAGGYIEI